MEDAGVQTREKMSTDGDITDLDPVNIEDYLPLMNIREPEDDN
jgi:hypothetical protein